MPFQQSEFVQVLKSVGQLALCTLLSNKPLLQRSEILRIAGKFALEYGFFAGDKNFSEPTADTYVTYAHRSIEEFFGSFGFIQALDDGNSVDDILGFRCEKPIFLASHLVSTFCLWFLRTDLFNFSEKISETLAFYTAKQIDSSTINVILLDQMYPGLSIRKAIFNRDSSKLEFLKRVFERLERVCVLHITSQDTFGRSLNLSTMSEGILRLMGHSLLSKLTMLSISVRDSLPPATNSNEFTISVNCIDFQYFHHDLKPMVTKYDVFKRLPQVCVRIYCKNSRDLCTLIQKNTRELNLVWGKKYFTD